MKTQRVQNRAAAFDTHWKKFVEALRAAPTDRNVGVYVAEFLGLARQTLSEEDHKLFRLHFLLRGSRKRVCDRLGIRAASFNEGVERIRQELGKAAEDQE